MIDTRPHSAADTKDQKPPQQLSDFSLVAGGPLYQFWRHTRLSGDAMEGVHRRVIALVLLTWVPLLVLSIAEGNAWGAHIAIPFVEDIDTHLRLLLAGPLLILAEVVLHRSLPRIVRPFVDNGLVPDEARPQFDAAIASALGWRNSVVAELLLIAFVYAVGLPIVFRDLLAIDVNSWFATTAAGELLAASYAGRWLAWVSMPMIQFLLLRYFYRLFIWARFLWQVSRIRLRLEPTHPDGAAGLLFLARSGRAYRHVLLAVGTMLSGFIANRIFHDGASLAEFKVEIFGTVALMVFLVLGPMMVFYPQLRAIRRRGMIEYGALGQTYTREFSSKWLRGSRAADEPLLGNADFQNLADLQNAFKVIRGIQLLPFTMGHVTALAVTTLLPIAPLLLTVFSVEQLIDRMLKTLL
jgi:hypothetical protein